MSTRQDNQNPLFIAIIMYVIMSAISGVISKYAGDNFELLFKPNFSFTSNIYLKLICIGLVSGIFGGLGHLVGRTFGRMLGKNSFKERFLNDFLRIFFFIFSSLFLYGIFFEQGLSKLEVLIISFYSSISSSLVCACIYPFLNRLFFGDYDGANQEGKTLAGILWMTTAGFMFGMCGSGFWSFYCYEQINMSTIYTTVILTTLYGVFLGAAFQVIGGVGVEDNVKTNLTLTSSIVGFLFILPFSIIYFFYFQNIIGLIIFLYSGLFIGIVLRSSKLIKKINRSLVSQHGDQATAKLMIVSFMLITNFPWGVALSFGLISKV